jgi:hypothetical protein
MTADDVLVAAKTAQAAGVARQTAHTWKAVLDECVIDLLREIPKRERPARLYNSTNHGFGTGSALPGGSKGHPVAS